LKRVPNSGFRFSQAAQIPYIYKMYLKGIKACYAQAFATVLAIHSEISEQLCLKRISDLVRNRRVLLRLGSDNSCPTRGHKQKAEWRSCFQAKLVHLHVHERLIYCWSDNSKTTREWNAFARTLLPFQVALLTIAKN